MRGRKPKLTTLKLIEGTPGKRPINAEFGMDGTYGSFSQSDPADRFFS